MSQSSDSASIGTDASTESTLSRSTTTTADGSPYVFQPQDGEFISYVDQHGDWEHKKITILAASMSLATQLKVGQDLTKMSVPCIFLRPYSMMEVYAKRHLTFIDTLLRADKLDDPVERILAITSWMTSQTLQEMDYFEKKPLNAILGEEHIAWVETEYGLTTFVGEQVSHHPPVSVICVNNEQQNISVLAVYSFNVKFYPNSLVIKVEGEVDVSLHNHKEKYLFSRGTPDIGVKKLIFGGKKQIEWNGKIHIDCEQSKCSADLQWIPTGGQESKFKGVIYSEDKKKTEWKIKGICGADFTKDKADKKKDKKEAKKKGKDGKKDVWLSIPELPRTIIQYPRREFQSEMSSMRVWEEVGFWIVHDELERADEAKMRVEELERKKRAERESSGNHHQSKYFKFNEIDKKWAPSEVSISDRATHLFDVKTKMPAITTS